MRKAAPAERRTTLNIRIPRAILEGLREVQAGQAVKPSLTQVCVTAFERLIDDHRKAKRVIPSVS